jgi:hypothetical protein
MSDFTYSFKIDKHYFNVVQYDTGFELRVDNRSFNSLMSEEKSGRLNKKEDKPKPVAKKPKR